MSRTTKGEGTKIAQAAKDLNVTSVTIRRYLAEFNIETTTDENGVKVLPAQSMDELQEIRRLKEDGLTNPKVMEFLEEMRAKGGSAAPAKSKAKATRASRVVTKQVEEEPEVEAEAEAEAEEEPKKARTDRPAARRIGKVADKGKAAKKVEEPVEEAEEPSEDGDAAAENVAELPAVRTKHSLTCQTCGKVFEHMNPRLRDCLDCYRTKRKERRRGSGGGAERDRHKNVIQHPLAQQAVTKSVQQQTQQAQPVGQPVAAPAHRQSTVRNYRKAIEETRGITSNLKRRLERPDLPEGERRWLEQIYAYQLILHQGWRHLAEYKSANREQAKADRAAAEKPDTREY